MKNVFLFLVVFIFVLFYCYGVCGLLEFLFVYVVLEEMVSYGGFGVELDFDYISVEFRVMFFEDDGWMM